MYMKLQFILVKKLLLINKDNEPLVTSKGSMSHWTSTEEEVMIDPDNGDHHVINVFNYII